MKLAIGFDETKVASSLSHFLNFPAAAENRRIERDREKQRTEEEEEENKFPAQLQPNEVTLEKITQQRKAKISISAPKQKKNGSLPKRR